MGVTIHYRGRLRRPADIQPFIDELADICQSAGWKHDRHHFTDPEVRGVIFQPHEKCESVQFLFLEDGTMTNFFALQFGQEEKMPWTFTKTQFAGADVHVGLCRLFKYFSDRWFEVLEVADEGGFYETMNREELQQKIDLIDAGIQAITEGLSASPLGEDETLESRLLRIMAEVQKRRGTPGK